MLKPKLAALVAVAACALPPAARAQDSALDEIRREIQQMKETYEKQIKALEQRLKDAEAAAAKAQSAANQAEKAASEAQSTATQAQSAATQAQSSAGQAQTTAQQAQSAATQVSAPNQASQNSFNPGLSLILQGGYYNFDRDPTTIGITGYVPPGGLDLPDRGFALGETEITIAANIDHLFFGQATLAIEDGVIEAEEAFFQTLALGHGLTLKGGRFFSGIGYENSIHRHAWDFSEPAMVQQVFLGPNLAMDGLQVSWIAPLPVFVELGGEIGKPVEFPNEFTDANKNGIAGSTLFARVGGDIGVSSSYRAGAWWLQSGNRVQTAPILDLDERTGVTNGLTGGNTNLWGLDFVYKWAPNGNRSYQNFKFIAEWMQRTIDGDLTYDVGGPNDRTGSFQSRQSGWYAQGIYQFHPQWRAGLRYGQLLAGSYTLAPNLQGLAGLAPADFSPKRISAMIDWNPSEFSRFRLQYNYAQYQQGFDDNQFFLEYILSLGVHGAHKF